MLIDVLLIAPRTRFILSLLLRLRFALATVKLFLTRVFRISVGFLAEKVSARDTPIDFEVVFSCCNTFEFRSVGLMRGEFDMGGTPLPTRA